MIAALSLMKRRADISVEAFRKHWLDPHGVMTAELPGVRRYVQSHCIASPSANALAGKLDIIGFAELWFDDTEARRIAYTSPRIAECNIDSEQFIGAVTRLVTEPKQIIRPPSLGHPAKAILVATGASDPAWAGATEAIATQLPGVVGYLGHRLLEQAAAPNSRIEEFKLVVAGVAEVWFESEARLRHGVAALANATGAAADRVAIYAVEDFLLV